MRNFITYFIKYPIVGNVLMILILVFGGFGLSSLKSTFFPETETKLIAVSLVYPGASPEEIEEGVVNKIEDNLKGMTGVDRVSSVSRENAGTVTVEIKRGYKIDLLLQDVKNAVDQIPTLPVDLEPPVVFKQEFLTLALNFSLSGDVDLGTLKRYAREVETELLAQDGISKVSLSGFPDEEIEIRVKEDVLRAYGITFDQVASAIRTSNLELTGGTIKGKTEEVLIRTRSKKYYAESVKDIIVSTKADGRKVYLYEVAEVRDQFVDAPSGSYVNGNPSVSISVNNTIDESLLDIADKVNAYVEEFNESHTDVQATIINDGSVLLRQRIDLLANNGLVGIILVLVLLALFLQLRLAFWVALAIPVSFAGMFMIGALVGLQINVLSLFGMILVIGILVDDGIVISENIFSHWERGKDPIQAAIDGTMEVLPAVISAILTTMVAFALFFFLDGITGDFFKDVALVVILTLGFSLVEGALILPAHVAHSKALTREENKKDTVIDKVQKALSNFMEWMRLKIYEPQLKIIFKYPIMGVALPVTFLMIAFSLIGGGVLKTTIFPVIEGDFITVNVKMPAGTTEDVTMKWLDHVEQAAWRVNERYKDRRPDGKDVVLVVSKSQAGTTYEGNILINMLDSETRQEFPSQASSLAFADSIKAEAGIILGAEEVSYTLASPFGKAVSIALFSKDLKELEKAVEVLKDSLDGFSDLRNVVDNNQTGLRELNVTLKDKARLLGLDLQTVVGQVRQGFFGAEVQRLQRGEDEVRIWVRYDESDRQSVGDLEDMRIRTQDGSSYPLREIATLAPTRGVIAINHLDGQREIRVSADAASADVSTNDVINEIQSSLLPNILKNFPSVFFSMEGQTRDNAKTNASISRVGPIVLIFLFVIILLTFRSVSQTLAVFTIIPFGLIGVLFGHFLLGKAFSFILSGLGVLALIGIMVNDALVLVSQFNTLIKQGKPFREALFEAASGRFRPIFLTSVTTIAGLLPLIAEKSLQAQFLIPMAITIAFGLAVATLLVLVTLPSLILLTNWYKRMFVWLWTGEEPEATSLEPAVENRESYFGVYFLGTTAIVVVLVFLSMLGG